MESNIEEKIKQDVMVSNLPLLFSNGKPIALTSMKVEDVQYFVHFLMKCILGCEPPGWAKFPKFKWWSADIPWSPIILTKKYQTPNWGNKLQALVKNCYNYNGCDYLLQFSAKLQTLNGGYKFEDNWDGTTSMYDSTSGKLLVTFQNENMNYDKVFRQQSSANRPMLLPRLNSPTSPAKLGPGASNSLAIANMVEPPDNDIYLCDYCGADFSSLSAIKAHESKCMAEKALEATSSNSLELECQEIDQAKFMWYLSLSSCSQTLPPPNITPAKARPVIKRACTLSDKRFTTIPFSSNLGQSWKATRLTQSAAENLVTRYERLCVAKPILARVIPIAEEPAGQLNPIALNRLRPVFSKRKEEWFHSYSFNKADRRERMKTIASGLNKRARLLARQCRIARVHLERLSIKDIKMWSRPKPKQNAKHRQPLLQPWLQRSIANLPSSCTISLAPVDAKPTYFLHQIETPSLMTSRPVSGLHLTATKPNVPGKLQSRSPQGLPLITSAWSMQTMQSVKPNYSKCHSPLPDLIPIVNTNSNTRPSHPVIVNMPSMQSPRSVASSPKLAASSTKIKQSSIVNPTEIVDLCSSEEDDSKDEKRPTGSISEKQPTKLVLPPGISITKINRIPNGANCGPKEIPTENNNNKARRVAQWINNSVSGSPPLLKFMGQHPLTVKKDTSRSAVADTSLADSLNIVKPLKIGTLSAEKREQMKQSLLKIQQQEGKTTSSGEESTLANAIQPSRSDESDPLQLTPIQPALHSSKNISRSLGDEFKKQVSKQQDTRRKRPIDPEFYSCDEGESSSDGPNKKNLKLDLSPSSTSRIPTGQYGSSDNYSTVIEVDLGGPDTENRGSSSSFGSLTPDSRNSRKRNELGRLLNDECKELRRKGLGDLSVDADSNQRITRCRTKSLPLMANKQ